MLIFDREHWPKHRPWLIGVLLISAAATAWCVAAGLSSRTQTWRWPSGGSLPGFTLGVAGGLIIAFEMLLWPRKSLWRGQRLGRTKHWMLAHLWLGVLALPLLLLHGGFHFNPARSTLAAVLMWLLVGVFVSGVFGAVVQNVVPRMMLRQLPAETIVSQIENVLARYHDDAGRLVALTCGEAEAVGAAAGAEASSFAGVSLRSAGALQGKVAGPAEAWAEVPESGALREAFDAEIGPYLAARDGRESALANAQRAGAFFTGLKLQLPPAAHRAVDRLAELCDQRRQFDIQRRLHGWLHTWLAFHVALSAALFLLMIAHIILALKFI